MLTILVANSKGGSGKTTIATNLAAAYAQGGMSVCLADLDRQRSSLRWLERRPGDRPGILGLDWSKQVSKRVPDVSRLVIDAPAAMRKADVDALLPRADIVVVPVQPSVFDELATARFLSKIATLRPIRWSRIGLAVVGNRVKPRTRAAQRLEEFLIEHGHPLTARLSDASIYGDCAEAGLGLYDLTSRRAGQLRGDWKQLIEAVERVATG